MSALRMPLASQMRANSLRVAFGSMARRDSAIESSGLSTHLSTASMRANSRSTVLRKDRAKLVFALFEDDEDPPPPPPRTTGISSSCDLIAFASKSAC